MRLGGVLANSRAFGDNSFKVGFDLQYSDSSYTDVISKRYGVFAEPSITKRVLRGQDWACLIVLSDGISGAMSDGEICDLVRGNSTPAQASQAIVAFAEKIGSDDNMTAVVAPLPGWGTLEGQDRTADRRAYRLKQAENTRRKRM